MMLAKCRNEEHASFQMIIATRKAMNVFLLTAERKHIYNAKNN